MDQPNDRVRKIDADEFIGVVINSFESASSVVSPMARTIGARRESGMRGKR